MKKFTNGLPKSIITIIYALSTICGIQLMGMISIAVLVLTHNYTEGIAVIIWNILLLSRNIGLCLVALVFPLMIASIINKTRRNNRQ